MSDCPNCCQLAKEVACLKENQQTLWNEVFGAKENSFIFIGNMGVPIATATENPSTNQRDIREYSYGAGLVNHLDPTGLFIVGDANYDYVPTRNASPPPEYTDGTYNLINQESKITLGFSDLLIRKKIWPVMGDLDYYLPYTPDFMNKSYLRLFDYIPDAHRYYSVYDQNSNTEFFVLSSGRRTRYSFPDLQDYTFPDDADVGGQQHEWFFQRCSSSPAKNKVVIFHDPFVSIANVIFYGEPDRGEENVFTSFLDWDFQSLGVRLIINGHSGNSFHLERGPMHIVNSSAFIRSRFGLTQVPAITNPPSINTLYGDQGWAIRYFSVLYAGTNAPFPENIFKPAGSVPFICPKNEVVRILASKGGLKVQFISYDPYLSSLQAVIENYKMEYEFEIQSLD